MYAFRDWTSWVWPFGGVLQLPSAHLMVKWASPLNLNQIVGLQIAMSWCFFPAVKTYPEKRQPDLGQRSACRKSRLALDWRAWQWKTLCLEWMRSFSSVLFEDRVELTGTCSVAACFHPRYIDLFFDASVVWFATETWSARMSLWP